MKDKKIELPTHVAVIMDGNRRWARSKGVPALMGHKKVVDERVEELIEHAGELGIPYITFWAWSTENWGRKEDEVKGIMNLFRWALERKAKSLIAKGARFRVIGNIEEFDEDIQNGLRKLMNDSAENRKITATFALNYGGRDEILRAVTKLLKNNSKKDGELKLDEDKLKRYLDTDGMPDPDLIIRTSGEQRLSGFMPWQSVYAELYFTEVMMPDFGADEFDGALKEYKERNRRFGKG